MRTIYTFYKIAILSYLFFSAFYFYNSSSFHESIELNSAQEMFEIKHFSNDDTLNKYNFKPSNVHVISHVGVALSTNIGMKFTTKSHQHLYKSIPSLLLTVSPVKSRVGIQSSGFFLPREAGTQGFSSDYMHQIQDYSNLLNANIQETINVSKDKSHILGAYTQQLRLRYSSSQESLVILEKQKLVYAQKLKDTQDIIEETKLKMSDDFYAFNQNGTQENIHNFLNLKAKHTTISTRLVFINQYIQQLEEFNTYNIKLLGKLEKNKLSIINANRLEVPNITTRNQDTNRIYKGNSLIEQIKINMGPPLVY